MKTKPNWFDTSGYRPDREEKDTEGITHYYRNGREYKIASRAVMQTEMGRASKLINNMVRHGASDEEIAQVIKYSSVVLDTVKDHLDYEQSAIDNDIHGLEERYSL